MDDSALYVAASLCAFVGAIAPQTARLFAQVNPPQHGPEVATLISLIAAGILAALARRPPPRGWAAERDRLNAEIDRLNAELDQCAEHATKLRREVSRLRLSLPDATDGHTKPEPSRGPSPTDPVQPPDS